MTTNPKAGWARATGQRASEGTHWWRPDDRQACERTMLSYSGPRTLEFPAIGDVCVPCLSIVTSAIEDTTDVLGFSIAELTT